MCLQNFDQLFIYEHLNFTEMLRRQVLPNDPRVSGLNPGGSGVEFWHQADFSIIWNSIRAPPSNCEINFSICITEITRGDNGHFLDTTLWDHHPPPDFCTKSGYYSNSNSTANILTAAHSPILNNHLCPRRSAITNPSNSALTNPIKPALLLYLLFQ